jgi:hypothetical protein
MRQYMDFMRGPSRWEIPVALKAALREARTARQDARAVLDHAEKLLRHANDVWANKRDLLRDAALKAAANEKVEEALGLERIRQDAEIVCNTAERAVKTASSVQANRREELAAADGRVRQIKSGIQRAHLDEVLVARINAIRTEEREIAFLISAARLRHITTPAAEGALDGAPARPTSIVTMPNPGLIADINTKLGHPEELAAAQEYWRKHDAAVDNDDADDANDRERAA